MACDNEQDNLYHRQIPIYLINNTNVSQNNNISVSNVANNRIRCLLAAGTILKNNQDNQDNPIIRIPITVNNNSNQNSPQENEVALNPNIRLLQNTHLTINNTINTTLNEHIWTHLSVNTRVIIPTNTQLEINVGNEWLKFNTIEEKIFYVSN